MIYGFEEETKPLTEEELNMVPIFVKGLESKIGIEKAITNNKMIAGLKAKGLEVNGARVRKIINYIRLKKLVRNLVASSKGYYVEQDTEKLAEYIYSLKQRAEAILAVANSYYK